MKSSPSVFLVLGLFVLGIYESYSFENLNMGDPICFSLPVHTIEFSCVRLLFLLLLAIVMDQFNDRIIIKGKVG